MSEPTYVREVKTRYGRALRAPESTIRDGRGAAALFRRIIGTGADKEHFVVVALDAKHRPLAWQVVSVGTVSTTIVRPAEVFRIPVMVQASAIVCAHNHPSGDATPSPDDIAVSRRLKGIGEVLGIPLLDHVVVTDMGCCSAMPDPV